MNKPSKTQTYFAIAAAVTTIITGAVTGVFHSAQLYLLWQNNPDQMQSALIHLFAWVHIVH